MGWETVEIQLLCEANISTLNQSFSKSARSPFQHIRRILDGGGGAGPPSDCGVGGVGHLFLVGGFAESPMVQEAVREEFGSRVRVIIPQV